MNENEGNEKITDRQRAARRVNGAKSNGPKTAAGKARSSQNAFKHGVYASTSHSIGSGPLKESADEVGAFHDGVVASLMPGDDPLLGILADVVAVALWRMVRVARWEAAASSSVEVPEMVYTPDWCEFHAAQDRRAAATLDRLGDPNLPQGLLMDCLSRVGHLRKARDDESWHGLRDDADAGRVRAVIIGLVDKHFGTFDEAIRSLHESAVESVRMADERRSFDMPLAARKEMLDGAVRQFVRLAGDAAREADRALARYWSQFDRVLAQTSDSRNEPTDEQDD